ncbi:sugar transporter, partial [Streptomyces cavourensis]|nr:sugar transporter [Streptomyces cavourensis]
MKRKLIAAIGVAGMLVSVAACGSDDKASSQDPKDRKETLTVWLMGEAQSTWPELVKDTNA